MSYTQVRAADPTIIDTPNACHRFARRVFGVGPKYQSAWENWVASSTKQTGNPPTNVAVPCWFSMTATINGVRKNWGHVVAHIPGVGYISVPPGSGVVPGRRTYQSIAEVEKAFGCRYVGWTYDINDAPVIAWVPDIQEEDEDMDAVYVQDAATKGQGPVYRINANGTKRSIPTAEWSAIRAQEKAAAESGHPAPVIVGQISAINLSEIPGA